MSGRRNIDAVIEWAKGEIDHPDRSYRGLCLSFCRTAYGVPAFSPSAKDAWHKIPEAFKHHGGKPSDAPRGALLFYDSGNYGHVAIAVGVSSHDKCISNDYVRSGKIDYAPRSFSRWGEHFVGYAWGTPSGHYNLRGSGLWVPRGRS
jgi:hypothetical protein